MVAPVTGPFIKEWHSKVVVHPVTGGNVIQGAGSRLWFRQRKPHNIPLIYSYEYLENVGVGYNGYPSVDNVPGYLTNVRNLAHNKAYGRFVNSLGESSQWAVNLAEQHSALSMIANRAKQLAQFTRAIRRADIIAAAQTLSFNQSVNRSGKNKAKAWSNTWLEYHFGWEPLLKDIYAALDSFTDPHLSVSRPVKGSGSETNTINSGYTGVEKSSCRMGGIVKVNNPNLHLASQLGLVNPLSVAWELVPFSFVVDWFSNVGQVLASYTDFAGCSIENAYTGTLITAFVQDHLSPIAYNDSKRINASRGTGISGPDLAVKPFRGLSPVRGITAISLLVQSMK